MSARTPLGMERAVADVVAWLHAHAAPTAVLRADSRALEAGDVFVAYPVAGSDNRAHIGDALARGACAVLYQGEDGAKLPACEAPALPVAGLAALAGPVASAWYGEPSRAMRMIAVTGTNGKTTCSHWIAHGLDATSTRCAIVGTLGSGFPGQLAETGFTTPDAPQLQHCLAGFRARGAAAVAMEVSSHALHQGRVNGTAFDIAVFTNLTQDHLDYHGTLAAYEAAKASLFDWPTLSWAVINRDDAAGRRLLAHTAGKVRRIAYGIDDAQDSGGAEAVVSARDVRAIASGTAFQLACDWGSADVEVATLGRFNVSNLLAVFAAWMAGGMVFADAVAALARLQPINGRMERLGGRADRGEPLVVVDYAHTPDALEQTLATLRPIAQQRGGKLICMFGCGGDRDTLKRPLMGAIAERLADAVVLTSDNPRHEAPAGIIAQIAAGMHAPDDARRIEDRASAILQSIRAASAQDVVLLAGRGHETAQDVLGKRRPFADQEHARLALAARATATRGGQS